MTAELEDTWVEPLVKGFLQESTALQSTSLEVGNNPEEFTAAVIDRIDLVLIIASIAIGHTFATEAIRSLRKFFDSFGVFVNFD
jgi:hypothetical protein